MSIPWGDPAYRRFSHHAHGSLSPNPALLFIVLITIWNINWFVDIYSVSPLQRMLQSRIFVFLVHHCISPPRTDLAYFRSSINICWMNQWMLSQEAAWRTDTSHWPSPRQQTALSHWPPELLHGWLYVEQWISQKKKEEDSFFASKAEKLLQSLTPGHSPVSKRPSNYLHI